MHQKLVINNIEIEGFEVDYEVGPSAEPPADFIVPSFPSYSNLKAKFTGIGKNNGYGDVEINGKEFTFYTPYEFDLSTIAEEFNQEHSDDAPMRWETVEGIDKSVKRLHIYFPGFIMEIGEYVIHYDACEWWVDLFQSTTLEDLCNLTYYTANGETYLYYAALEGEEPYVIDVMPEDEDDYVTLVAKDNDDALFHYTVEDGVKLATFDIKNS